MISLPIDSVDIGYVEHGAGPAVVLVHAGVFSDWFGPLSEQLAPHGYRVGVVRRAGYGASAPSRHLTIADHADHLMKLAAHLHMDSAHWVGHSSGCQIILQLAVEQPHLVRSLTLLEPAAAGAFAVPAAEELGRTFVGPALSAFAAGDVERAFDLFMRGVGGEDYRATLAGRLGAVGVAAAVRQSAFFFRDEVPAVLESRFSPLQAAQIACPVLVVEGADSSRSGPLAAQITARALEMFPRAEMVRVPGANHLLPLQQPESLAHIIHGFLSRQP